MCILKNQYSIMVYKCTTWLTNTTFHNGGMQNVQHSQAMLERELCELAHFFFHSSFSKYVISFQQKIPEGNVIVLHACAHNPTGVDPKVWGIWYILLFPQSNKISQFVWHKLYFMWKHIHIGNVLCNFLVNIWTIIKNINASTCIYVDF